MRGAARAIGGNSVYLNARTVSGGVGRAGFLRRCGENLRASRLNLPLLLAGVALSALSVPLFIEAKIANDNSARTDSEQLPLR
jgi:hypothetical protein